MLTAACLLLAGHAAVSEPTADIAPKPAVDYARDIRPILAENCFACHGPDGAARKASLRLDRRQDAVKAKAIVPGKPDESALVERICADEPARRMPPLKTKKTLTGAQKDLLKRWIAAGAEYPRHWSLVAPKRPEPPPVKDAKWVRNPIDAFVLARLEEKGLKPSPEADRPTLLRRVALDLTGLPPTPEEIDAFVKDRRPDAYERQVDRLLASPHYGERWGRHWLDLARYADSNGYSIDAPRSIWPYRDWVIAALNRDLLFDQFTIEQLAGDLLPNATVEQRVATGFHRNTPINEEGGVDKEQFRIESVVDRVNTTGSVWLGLTVGCCQCHDHKFDPLTQREYYRLFAFLNNQDEPTLPLSSADLKAIRSEDQTPAPAPKGKVTTMVLQELKTPRETHVLRGGDFTRPGDRVTPDTPAVLPPLPKHSRQGERNRLDLARWLVSSENPLTARVTVNRIWGLYFGVGIVETENDFGTQGTPPSHLELLDWLACEFVRQGWSLKALHKRIVTSATYRQSSAARPDLEMIDPRNRLLARQARLRLEAEVVRDAALTASGLLDRRVGGPSVFPPQPEGVYEFTQIRRKWVPSEGPDRYRRGLYTYVWRAAPHPALGAFDAPDAGTTCTRRNRSNTPLQSLTLLNDAGFAEYAYGLAARVLRDGETSEGGQVRRAFRLCLGREPDAPEAERLAAFLSKQQAHFAAHADEATRLLRGGGPAGKQLAEVANVFSDRKAALVLLTRVLLNLDEFITRE
jgi:hypothetical protein